MTSLVRSETGWPGDGRPHSALRHCRTAAAKLARRSNNCDKLGWGFETQRVSIGPGSAELWRHILAIVGSRPPFACRTTRDCYRFAKGEAWSGQRAAAKRNTALLDCGDETCKSIDNCDKLGCGFDTFARSPRVDRSGTGKPAMVCTGK